MDPYCLGGPLQRQRQPNCRLKFSRKYYHIELGAALVLSPLKSALRGGLRPVLLQGNNCARSELVGVMRLAGMPHMDAEPGNLSKKSRQLPSVVRWVKRSGPTKSNAIGGSFVPAAKVHWTFGRC